MKITDIKLNNLKKRSIYYYIDDNNTQIKPVRVSDSIKENSGYFLIAGEIKINDGTKYPALLGISSDDSGEMYEAYFYIDNKLINQNESNFFEQINKTKNQIFPYKYHLNVNVDGDKHIAHQ